MTSLDYEELVAVATIGCSTRPIRVGDLEPAVTQAVPAEASGADLVLDAAAVYALHRRAALEQANSTQRIEIPSGSRPVVSTAYQALVRRLLNGSNDDRELAVAALHDLHNAREDRVALPPDLLSEIMANASKPGRANLARAVLPLLDAKDRSVASLVDPTWATLLERASQRVAQPTTQSEDSTHQVAPDWNDWETGSKAARLEFFAALRRTDPRRAAELLADPAFKKEKAADRAELIELLAVGLEPADEQLLMDLLRDRAAAPRGAAHNLLRRLPQSQLVSAAESAVLANLSIERSKPGMLRRLSGGKPELQLSLNSIELTDELTKLGFEADTGRKLLALLLPAVPTDRWPELVGASAAELVTAKTTIDGVAEALTSEWAAAAANWRDEALALVLLDEKNTLAPDAAEFVAPESLVARLEKVVRNGKPAEITRLVDATTGELSMSVIDELVAKVRATQKSKDPATRWMTASLLRAIGDQTPAAAARQVAEEILKMEFELHKANQARQVAAQLQLRAAIAEAIDSCPNPGDNR